MIRPCYATREDTKAALDIAEVSRTNPQIDREIEAASDAIDKLCRRTLYPRYAARTFDYPDQDRPTSWRYWLAQHDLISLTALTSGGTAITSGQYLLRPDSGPPFTEIELSLATDAAFGGGDTWQRDITVTGLWGYTDDQAPAGALAEALDATETAVDVTDSTAVGVGDLLTVGTERMLVTGRRMLTTGQTAGGSGLTASMANQSLTVQTGAAFAEGEVLLLDAEKVRVDEIAGNVLTVKRGVDGSTLAAHTAGTVIYAARTLTVVRGAVGSTAASHDTATAATRWVPPPLVRTLAIATALTTLLQQRAGYVGGKGSGGDGKQARTDYGADLPALREQVRVGYGRTHRHLAV